MKILTWIKTIDFLGEGINFSINKRSSFQTVAGGFISILIYILYVYFFYFFGADFIFKENPNVYSQVKTSNDDGKISKINLNFSDFIFGIRLEDYWANPIEIDKYVFPRINYTKGNFNETTNTFDFIETEIDLVSCDKYSKILEKIPNKQFNLSTFLCPNFTKVKDAVELGGYWDDKEYWFLKFDLSICKDVEMKNCKDVKNLVKSISEQAIYVSMIYPEVIFNADNYIQPFQFRFKNYFNYLTTKIQVIDEIFLGNNILNQDAGIIFQDNVEFKESSIIRIVNKPVIPIIEPTDNSKIVYNLNNNLYEFYLIFDKNYNYHTRIYSKFQDLLANVNGFMELVIFLLGFFYSIFNKYRLDAYIFNRLIFIKDFKKDMNVHHKPMNFYFNKISSIEDISKKPKREINIENLNSLGKNSTLKAGNTSDLSEIKVDLKSSIIDKKENISANISARPFILNNENIELKEIQEKKIKVYSENVGDEEFIKTITRFLAFKNEIAFKFIDYLKFCFVGDKMKKKDHKQIPIFQLLEMFTEKISDKFDIFNYLKKIKQFKLFKKFYCYEEQNKIIKTFSKKIYCISPYEVEKQDEYNTTQKEIQKEQNLINFFKHNKEEVFKNQKLLELIV